ncbi:hypothetical protein C4D60_Mb05t21600 [Musa balbisiana]|uniref:Uncharacterized protein n=1 Tax=Musa balbisiana TaxID=52838 RepID=A0A4S8JXU9_MUSBA|nr:hypothetical protein C4D60_Mb05t21600 [Musa balbisiana]
MNSDQAQETYIRENGQQRKRAAWRCKKGKLKQSTAPPIEEGEGDLKRRRRYGLPTKEGKKGGVFQGLNTSNVWAFQ